MKKTILLLILVLFNFVFSNGSSDTIRHVNLELINNSSVPDLKITSSQEGWMSIGRYDKVANCSKYHKKLNYKIYYRPDYGNIKNFVSSGNVYLGSPSSHFGFFNQQRCCFKIKEYLPSGPGIYYFYIND